MHDYKHILVALDIYAAYEPIIQRAQKLAGKQGDISLIHVTPPRMYFEPYGMAFETDFVSDIQKQSNKKLNNIAKKYKIPEDQVHCRVGHPADEIHDCAESMKADLIVLGTHGRSGLKLLLGSTANGVLHGAKCDVLAIKV